jgi:hypothetical protein
MKDNPVAPVFCSIWSNTPEMYIANRNGDTGEPCGIPVFVGFIPVSWPLMTREAFRSVMKLFVHLTSSGSASSSWSLSVRRVLETWSNAPFTSIRRAPDIFPLPQFWYTCSVMHAAASVTECLFRHPNWPLCSLWSMVSDSRVATTFPLFYPYNSIGI